MLIKQRNKLMEVAIGLAVPALFLSLYFYFFLVEWDGVSSAFTPLFMITFLAVAPLMSESVIFAALALLGLFFLLVKYVPSPYLRIFIALHFSTWLYLGVLGASSFS